MPGGTGKHVLTCLPVRHAVQQRQTFPRAEVIILKDSGHWPTHDHPEPLERHAVDFLRAASKAAGGMNLPRRGRIAQRVTP